MDPAIRNLVHARLEEEPPAHDAWGGLVLAALEGPAALEAELAGRGTPSPREAAARTPPARTGAFLHSIAVEGFRGIGPSQTLELRPGPGLTLVVGRNGSGKSSFAEGLEVLLTGDSLRWKERAAVWREGWRNLHHPAASLVGAFLVEGERGPCVVSRRWEAGDGVRASRGVGPASRPGGVGARFPRLDRGPAHPPSVPLLQRARLAPRRGALEALRRALLHPGPRGPRPGPGRAAGSATVAREGAEGRHGRAGPPPRAVARRRRRPCPTGGDGRWRARSGTSARSTRRWAASAPRRGGRRSGGAPGTREPRPARPGAGRGGRRGDASRGRGRAVLAGDGRRPVSRRRGPSRERPPLPRGPRRRRLPGVRQEGRPRQRLEQEAARSGGTPARVGAGRRRPSTSAPLPLGGSGKAW